MLEKNIDFSHLSAQDIMSQEPKSVQRKSLVIKAAELIQLHNIEHLIVMERKNYYGIINFHDLLKAGIHL
ncbi:CBS domain-containing protein [Bacteroidetes bacterium endosymbiont of Geopemphigus sp.]|uniref:CBS domain-containing protein n=1 Tax=Bacteroidetes bacterium endosymbiont of Geopemphigus sp. TaxID=2047937 RepID=UPI000CCFF466|nr:CBS domain-containing protein [Bacteroidetes bacterium endosymbiont of Geopemphigus sp.]